MPAANKMGFVSGHAMGHREKNICQKKLIYG